MCSPGSAPCGKPREFLIRTWQQPSMMPYRFVHAACISLSTCPALQCSYGLLCCVCTPSGAPLWLSCSVFFATSGRDLFLDSTRLVTVMITFSPAGQCRLGCCSHHSQKLFWSLLVCPAVLLQPGTPQRCLSGRYLLRYSMVDRRSQNGRQPVCSCRQ